jgi:putative membrane protein
MNLNGWTYRELGSILVLVVLYIVGFVGMHTSSAPWFISLSPLTLLISTVLILIQARPLLKSFALVVVAVFLMGFGVEVLGVHTGLVFGEYSYGQTLGWKWLEVPVIIGCNWLFLLIGTAGFVHRLRIAPALRVAIGAALMTAMDVLIEPVAIYLGYWDWAGGTPPLQNYLAWFVVSLLMHSLFQVANFPKRNFVAEAVIVLQFLFFTGLNISILMS